MIAPLRRAAWPLLALGLALVAPAATGCATMPDVVRARSEGEGVMRAYPVPPDVAYGIARAVFREESESVEEHRDEWYLLATTGMTAFSYGTLMGAWIEQLSDGRVAVTVVTKRRLATNAVTVLSEEEFHERFAERVAVYHRHVKGGGAPPAR